MAQVRHPVGESGWLKTGHRTQMPEEVLWRPQGKFALFSVKGRPILGGAMLLPAGDRNSHEEDEARAEGEMEWDL